MVVSNRQGSEDDPEFGSRGGIGGREGPQSSSTTRYKLSSTAPSWIPAETRCNGAEERGGWCGSASIGNFLPTGGGINSVRTKTREQRRDAGFKGRQLDSRKDRSASLFATFLDTVVNFLHSTPPPPLFFFFPLRRNANPRDNCNDNVMR